MIVATGHKKNPILKSLEGEEGYTATPFRDNRIVEALQKAGDDGVTFVVGTGQAFMDFVGVAKSIDHKGKIIAVSGDLIEPWPRDHAKCRVPCNDYTFDCFTPEAVSDIIAECQTDHPLMVDKLRRLIQDEIHCDKALEVDPQNVIQTFTECCDDVFKPLFGEECADVFESVKGLFKGQDGNSTLPERFEAYKSLRDAQMPDKSAQLELRRGRVDSQKSFVDEHGKFQLVLTAPGQEPQTIEADAVINTASINRVPWSRDGNMAEQFHADLIACEDIARKNDETRMIESSIGPRLAFTGAGSGGAFGVPFIRKGCQESASAMVAEGLSRAKQREAAYLKELNR